MPSEADPIPPEELAKLDALEAAATPGPWLHDSRIGCDAVYRGEMVNCMDELAPEHRIAYRSGWSTGSPAEWHKHPRVEEDMALIVALRNAYPPIRAALREMQNEKHRADALAEANQDHIKERDAALSRVKELEEQRDSLLRSGAIIEKRDAKLSARVAELENELFWWGERSLLNCKIHETLEQIVAAWSESEHHDVPIALIEQARAALAAAQEENDA
jgi:hypothetical protein